MSRSLKWSWPLLLVKKPRPDPVDEEAQGVGLTGSRGPFKVKVRVRGPSYWVPQLKSQRFVAGGPEKPGLIRLPEEDRSVPYL